MKKHIAIALFGWASGLSSAQVFAARTEVRLGSIQKMGDESDVPLFRQTTTTTTDGLLRTSRSVIVDSEGKDVMREEARIQNGEIETQQMDQLQIKERYELKVEGSKLYFKTYNLESGSPVLKEEKTVAKPSDFVTGPSTEDYLRRQKEKLLAGKTVTADFGVFEYMTSVSFAFSPRKQTTDEKPLKLTMKVASFWLGFVVDPIEIELDRENFYMTRFKGRTPLRIKKGSKWESFDGDIVYTQKDQPEGT